LVALGPFFKSKREPVGAVVVGFPPARVVVERAVRHHLRMVPLVRGGTSVIT